MTAKLVSCDDAGPAVPVLREAMKSRLIQMEEALFIASGQRFEAESEAAAEAAYLSNSGRSHPAIPHHSGHVDWISFQPLILAQMCSLAWVACLSEHKACQTAACAEPRPCST